MPTHLLCMREDLDLLLARALWGIPMMLPQAAQTIVLPRMPCQVTQALTRNHKKVIQVNLHVSYSTCISIQILPYCPYLQLRQKNIQLLLMTMKPRMKMENVRAHPRPGVYAMSRYLQSSDISMRGHSRGMGAECLSRSEKKAAFSSYSSPALYNGQVMQRKELNKKAVTCY